MAKPKMSAKAEALQDRMAAKRGGTKKSAKKSSAKKK